MVSSTTAPRKRFASTYLHDVDWNIVLLRQVEDSRVEAIVPAIVMENLARVQAAMNRYHIHDPR